MTFSETVHIFVYVEAIYISIIIKKGVIVDVFIATKTDRYVKLAEGKESFSQIP